MPSSPPRRRLSSSRVLVPAAFLLALLPSATASYAQAPAHRGPEPLRGPLVAVQHGAFTLAGRPLPYLHGINYEGPPDRPWKMWQDGLFDPTLIAHDFDLIAAAGYNPVRIFIQHPLPSMILAGDFSRLDTVVALAAARGLRLLITFNDDGDPDLRRVARVERLVAAHLAGNPTIFGYDLRNEPNLIDIAASIYPAGAPLPLLSPALIAAYHERVSMKTALRDSRSGQWSWGGFAAYGVRKLYYYLNARDLLDAFLSANPGWPAVPALPYWNRFLSLTNRTLASYLYAQLTAIRAADPGHLITVGYSSRFWSALPANDVLGFRSIHIYPPADFDGFHYALRSFETLVGLAPTPLMLEEYGVSNNLTGLQSSAVREMAVSLYLRTLGGAGDIKWMFDDDAVGFNSYENNLGAVDAQELPKPTYLASSAANAYWSRTPYQAGLILQPDPVTGAGFVSVARDGMAIGGSLPYTDARVHYTPRGPGVLWLDWSVPGVLRIKPTGAGRLTVALGALTGATAIISPVLAGSLGPATAPVTSSAAVTPTLAGQVAPRAAIAVTVTASVPVSDSGKAAPSATVTPAITVPLTMAPTSTTTPTLQLPSPTPPPPSPTPTVAGPPAAPPGYSVSGGLTVTLSLLPGVDEAIDYQAPRRPPLVPIDLPAPANPAAWYVIARGHNVAPPFLTPWLDLGGAAGIGLPVTEAFAYHGLPTQYFDDVALRIGPHGLTTAPIGTVALNGARPAAPELPARIKHVYDRATGHNVHGFFLDFWLRYGGARFWGDPLTEEIHTHGEIIQYFSGAEFALRPGPHADVTLLPLGLRMWPSIRSVYGL